MILSSLQVEEAIDQESKPEERMKKMVVQVDSCLTQRSVMMNLLAEFETHKTEHVVVSNNEPVMRCQQKVTKRMISNDGTVSDTWRHKYGARDLKPLKFTRNTIFSMQMS